MRQLGKKRRSIGIRGQMMWFLCLICLLLLGLFWFLSTQLLEPLYTKHIQKQLTAEAEMIVAKMDDAIAKGEILSYWAFGGIKVTNDDFFSQLGSDIYSSGELSSFCVDISDATLRTIKKYENLSYCSLHQKSFPDTLDDDIVYSTARQVRQYCRENGAFARVLPAAKPSAYNQLVVGRMTADGAYTVLVSTTLMHVSEAGEVMSTVLPLAAALANVSHDLRTPLTLIKGYAETVRDITGDDKAHRDEQMNIIVDEADRLTALVSSVMELSKVTSGAEKCEKVHFDMGQLCDEVSERYDAVCAQNGWQLKLELPDEELPVYADPNMMQRALHNLLGNAMHHMGADGIFVLRAAPSAEGVRVEVEDHGPGIAAEDLPYIFDRYYRSRSDAGKQGTGLGLSITKAIFQQHGFRFGVQSTVGKGTTFWFIMTSE